MFVFMFQGSNSDAVYDCTPSVTDTVASPFVLFRFKKHKRKKVDTLITKIYNTGQIFAKIMIFVFRSCLQRRLHEEVLNLKDFFFK